LNDFGWQSVRFVAVQYDYLFREFCFENIFRAGTGFQYYKVLLSG